MPCWCPSRIIKVDRSTIFLVYKCFSLLPFCLFWGPWAWLFKVNTDGQTTETENLTVKLQNSNQNSRLSYVSSSGFWTTGPRVYSLPNVQQRRSEHWWISTPRWRWHEYSSIVTEHEPEASICFSIIFRDINYQRLQNNGLRRSRSCAYWYAVVKL